MNILLLKALSMFVLACCAISLVEGQNSTVSPMAAPAVILRQQDRQAPLPASTRHARFIQTRAETFSDVVKAELIGAALSAGLDIAQREMYEAMYRHGSGITAHIPLVSSKALNGLRDRILSRRNDRYRGFEFEYLSGVGAPLEITSESPIEFLITPPNPFLALQPVLIKANVLSKEGIRTLSSRKVELREKKDSLPGAQERAYDRMILQVEKQVPELYVHRNADGTYTARSATALPEGQYALAFQTGEKDAFELLNPVFEFRVRK